MRYFVHFKIFSRAGVILAEGSGLILAHPLEEMARLPANLRQEYHIVLDFYTPETRGRAVMISNLANLVREALVIFHQ